MISPQIMAVIVVVAVIAFFVGAALGLSAEKNYIKKHCELTGKFVINDETFECRKVYKSPLVP